jgi:cell division septation protein DedD
MEIEISEIKAAKPASPVAELEPVTEPVVVVKEPKQKVPSKESPIKQQRKALMVTPPPPPTPPPTGFHRNSFGFYVL